MTEYLESDEVEIIFHSSSRPKRCRNVEAMYTKGGLLNLQYTDGIIMGYPLANIFSVARMHRAHIGSERHE